MQQCPLTSVASEDPAPNGGPNKVTMSSYPVISNALIYVVIGNGGAWIGGRSAAARGYAPSASPLPAGISASPTAPKGHDRYRCLSVSPISIRTGALPWVPPHAITTTFARS
jgi:hypothetical protein